MKLKQLLFATVPMLICVAVRAQSPGVHFGIKGGLNVSSVNVDNGTDLDSKAGLYAGGLAHIHMTQHFALQPEVMYSAQGGKMDVGSTTYTTRLNYINIPVLGQYMFGDGWRLQTGPQLGFLANAKSKANKTTTDVGDGYKSTDFSWVFGASYVGKSGLGADARYNLGLSDIYEGPAKAMNRVFQVGLFYQFMH